MPARNNSFAITQTITTGNFTGFFDIQSGSNVFTSNCNSLHPTITQNTATGAVTWRAKTQSAKQLTTRSFAADHMML